MADPLANAGFPSAEELARAFHEAYEALAPEMGYVTRPESRKSWEDVPATNKKLMIATAAYVLDNWDW